MTRLREATQSARARGRKALVPFLTAGFPDEETFLALLVAASRAGADVIEIGIPFSDPIADGPIIQASSQRALRAGASLAKALDWAARAAPKVSAALVFMSYVNPLLRMGIKRFADRAAAAGVTGVIIPDLPVEESAEIRGIVEASGLVLVDLVAPTSGPERIARIAAVADGFLYLVSVAGVTGTRNALAGGLGGFATRVRAETSLPLYVGFGISSPRQAAEAARHTDGIIIGSALLQRIQDAPAPGEAVGAAERFLKEVRQAIDGVSASQRNRSHQP